MENVKIGKIETYINNSLSTNVVFLWFFLHNNPVAGAQRSHAYALFLSCNSTRHVHNIGLLPQGYCERKTPIA